MIENLSNKYGESIFCLQCECFPNSGIVVKERAVKLFLLTDYSDIRYTLDGTAAIRSGVKMDDHLFVSEPEELNSTHFHRAAVTTAEFRRDVVRVIICNPRNPV